MNQIEQEENEAGFPSARFLNSYPCNPRLIVPPATVSFTENHRFLLLN